MYRENTLRYNSHLIRGLVPPHLHHEIHVRNIYNKKTYLSTEGDSEFRYVFLFIINGFKYFDKTFHRYNSLL